MAKVRDIKRHITSVNKIQQITKAMYAISMTRVFKAKQQLLEARAYSDAQRALLADIIGDIDANHPLRAPTGEGKFVFVVNSDRGLCGRFKGDLNRHAEELMREDEANQLIIGGDKADLYFRSKPYPIAEKKYIHVYDKPTFEHARQIGEELLALYDATHTEIQVVYFHYINDFRQEVRVETLLPLTPPAEAGGETEAAPEGHEPSLDEAVGETLYEPSKEAVFEMLVPLYVKGQVYRYLLESKTSEHAIRRQAMRNASDNAEDIIRELTLEYNKARQQEITKQLLEVIGGAEALRQV